MKFRKRIWACLLAVALMISQSGITVLAAEPQISNIVVSPEHVSNAGGIVQVNVTGTGLTAENWGIEVHTYNEYGIDMDSRLKATVLEITESGATIQIPANTMKNGMEYRITAGIKDGSSITGQAQAVVTQDPKADTIKRTYRKVEMLDARTVVATLDAAVDTSPIDKSKIFIASQNNANDNHIELGENDRVTVSSNVITITFGENIAITGTSALYIQEGAFYATEDNKTLAVKMEYDCWSITSNPSASSVELSETILDHNGGTITATLKGTRLDEATSIEGKILLAGETETPTEIAVAVTPGAEPTLTYELPANDTEKAISYILSVKVNGNTVNEGTVENPAKRAVVTVLPEGTDKNAQVLSMATITGNNKLEGVGDNKNITVVVSKQLGELKTVMTLYGTNMDPTVTRVRAIDENGVIWPVYDIPE